MVRGPNFRCVLVCVVWLIVQLLLLLFGNAMDIHFTCVWNIIECCVCVDVDTNCTNWTKVVTVCVVCCSLTAIILFCACFQSKLIYVCFQLYLSTYGLMDWWMIWLAAKELSPKTAKQLKPVWPSILSLPLSCTREKFCFIASNTRAFSGFVKKSKTI